MDNYKVLKISDQQIRENESREVEIEKGKIYPEAVVDSMCSQNFEIYDELDSECEGDCIDCLIAHEIVELTEESEEN